MKTWLLLAILLGCSLFHRAEARLGETETEVDARYGTASHSGRDFDGVPIHLYRFGGFMIEVTFMKGKSACEAFKKENNTSVSDAEILRLLEVNKMGSDWNEKDDFDDATWRSWFRIDGEAKGWTLGRPTLFVISTRQFLDRTRQLVEEVSKKKQTDEQKRLQGF